MDDNCNTQGHGCGSQTLCVFACFLHVFNTSLVAMTTLRNMSQTEFSEGGYQNSFQTFISDEVRIYFQWIGYSIVCELIDVFGTASNIINIVCFLKMGFKDPVNISLLGNVHSCFLTVLLV